MLCWNCLTMNKLDLGIITFLLVNISANIFNKRTVGVLVKNRYYP